MSSFANAVYYPSWKVYKGKPPSSLDVRVATHAFYAFVRVNENGTLRLLDEFGDLQKQVDVEQGCLAAFAKMKRENPHLKTLVSIGGGSGSAEFPIMAADPAARETFAREAPNFCDKYEFDGVDIDWEHPTRCDEGENYVKLLWDVRRALPAPAYLVSTALPVGQYCLKHIDLRMAGALLDFLNLMAYDFTGAWTDVCGHQAQLLAPREDTCSTLRKSGAAGVDFVVANGFPREKTLLGVPAYARYFPQASGPGHSFPSAGEMEYSDMPESWISDAHIDHHAATASYVDSEGGKGFITFDVPGTVSAKARYVRRQQLGGLFYWTGVGDRQGSQSLVAAGLATLSN
ncbi:glycoside hydrolase superfamily [Emericellopsis atlantica]|uniref:chitinase n=1 Tax=Emericellopsis atlantica TaxID=2614577 RepID=A0A9P8CKV5_9HYPO|nr:glycoside hydrolase superfamily [Emericellopsis atlantica]KAG9250753.1 glycoside hydrolase superfamily [Emericellopsis atlantica]